MPLTNKTIYPLPALPTIGGAGSTFNDPTFGSRMARVTDGAWASSLGITDKSFSTPSAGYQKCFNADGTKFFVVCTDGSHILCSLNRTTLATARLGISTLPFGREPGHWHPTNPNLLYGIGTAANHHTIVQVDVTSIPWTTTTYLDLDTIRGGLSDTYVGALHVSNGYMYVSYGGFSQEEHRYHVWFPLGNIAGRKELDTVTQAGMDEGNTDWPTGSRFSIHSAQMDNSGRYVDLRPTGSIISGRPLAKYTNYFWDTTNDTVTPCRSSSGGHEVLGWGRRINADCLGPWDAIQWIKTPDLSDPNANRIDLISPTLTPLMVFEAEHSSWHNDVAGTSKPFLTATYRYYDGTLGDGDAGQYSLPNRNDVAWRCWDNEVISVETTAAGGTVTRFCHHRSKVNPDTGTAPFDFYYTPRANVDPLGGFCLVTSNWGKTLGIASDVGNHRTDVFLVELGLPGDPPGPSTEPRWRPPSPIRIR